jgi:hypothetical protein
MIYEITTKNESVQVPEVFIAVRACWGFSADGKNKGFFCQFMRF